MKKERRWRVRDRIIRFHLYPQEEENSGCRERGREKVFTFSRRLCFVEENGGNRLERKIGAEVKKRREKIENVLKLDHPLADRSSGSSWYRSLIFLDFVSFLQKLFSKRIVYTWKRNSPPYWMK